LTPSDQRVNPAEPKKKTGLSAEELANMEREMESLEKDFKAVKASFTENMMCLTCARGISKKLMDNAKVVRFLNANFFRIFFSGSRTSWPPKPREIFCPPAVVNFYWDFVRPS